MGNEADLPLSVTLQMDDQTRAQLRNSEGVIAIAESFEIDSPELAVAANNELRSIKERLTRIEALRKSFIAPAQQIIENANALFNPAREALSRGESIIKQRLLDYQTEERRKAEEARRIAEEAERKARQEAEAKSAAERAKAEQKAAETRRMAEEAEAARKRLEAEGKAKQAAQAAADAAKLREQAAATIENAEVKAQQIQLAAAAAAPAAVVAAPVKLEGFSARDNWICEFAQGHDETSVKQKIAAALPARPELLALFKLDMSAAGKMAKALKGAFNVPGLAARNDPIAASSRR